MDRAETFTLEMFIRVHGFGTAHAASFPLTSRGGQLFQSLGTLIDTLQQHAATQFSSTNTSKEGTARKAIALEALKDELEAISRTARALALTIPGLNDKFRLPRNQGAQSWLAAGRAFAADAVPFKDNFIQLGMPADFLDTLGERIEAVDEAINHKGQVTGEGVAASAAIDEAIDSGMKIARELDALVRNIFRDDPATLAEWTSARHIERAPRSATPQPPPATPPTT
jgi:ABC-type transporter Mla subunit MlaD